MEGTTPFTMAEKLTARLGPSVLLFAGSLALGLGLRATEPVAHAWGQVCSVTVWAELVEVRRVDGDGAIEPQQMSWYGEVVLTVPDLTLGLEWSDPYEFFFLEVEP